MQADRALLAGISGLAGRRCALDRLMIAVARLGSYGQILLWLSLLLPGGQRRHRAGWLRTAIALGLVTPPVLLLRRLAPRPRPFAAGAAVSLVAREPGPSFPSRHTASAVAMALVVRRAAPRRGTSMAALAALMGVSRIYCGLHYPSDVLAGAAIGALAARLALLGSRGGRHRRTF